MSVIYPIRSNNLKNQALEENQAVEEEKKIKITINVHAGGDNIVILRR